MVSSVNEVFKEMNSSQISADIENILSQSLEMETAMDMVLDRISMSTDGMLQEPSEDKVAIEDIEKLVEKELQKESDNLGSRIDSGLASVENQLNVMNKEENKER